MMRELGTLQAINEAVHQEMARDANVLFIGEDVRAPMRPETAGLFQTFGPDRVIDMPISEAGMTGFGTGAAMAGARPIVVFQVTSLIFPAFDQIVNQAAKLPHMLGGQGFLPITYLLFGAGARDGRAGQHSDNPAAYLAHAGIKTAVPADAYEAKGLVLSAIREDDPVAIVVSALTQAKPVAVPEESYALPLGEGKVRRSGRDVTLAASGHLVPWAVEVADALAGEGIDVEVWDPRCLLPLDRAGLIASVRKTGRLVIADDTARTCGFAAELSAVVAERAFDALKAPIRRVTRSDVPIPYSRTIEQVPVPDRDKMARAVRAAMGR